MLSLLDAFQPAPGDSPSGSPKKLGVLLHGPPGTGKTSLIKASRRLDRSIVSIPLGRIKTNQELFDAVFDMKYGGRADVPVRLTFKQTVFVLKASTASSVVLKRSASPRPVAPAPAPAEKDGDPIKALLECLFNGDDKAISGPTMALTGALKPTRDRLDLSGILNVLDGSPTRGRPYMASEPPREAGSRVGSSGPRRRALRLGYVQRTEARQMVEHLLRRDGSARMVVFLAGPGRVARRHPRGARATCAAQTPPAAAPPRRRRRCALAHGALSCKVCLRHSTP